MREMQEFSGSVVCRVRRKLFCLQLHLCVTVLCRYEGWFSVSVRHWDLVCRMFLRRGVCLCHVFLRVSDERTEELLSEIHNVDLRRDVRSVLIPRERLVIGDVLGKGAQCVCACVCVCVEIATPFACEM